MKKIYTILVLSFLIIPFFNIKSQAQIPTVQYTPWRRIITPTTLFMIQHGYIQTG